MGRDHVRAVEIMSRRFGAVIVEMGGQGRAVRVRREGFGKAWERN